MDQGSDSSDDEWVLAALWDSHRQMGDATRAQLAQLLTECRSSQALVTCASNADQTRLEARFLTLCEQIAAGADVQEVARCLMLVAVEASGFRVMTGSKDET